MLAKTLKVTRAKFFIVLLLAKITLLLGKVILLVENTKI